MVLSEITVTFLCAEGISHFGTWHQILLQLTAFPSPHSAEQEMWREKLENRDHSEWGMHSPQGAPGSLAEAGVSQR